MMGEFCSEDGKSERATKAVPARRPWGGRVRRGAEVGPGSRRVRVLSFEPAEGRRGRERERERERARKKERKK